MPPPPCHLSNASSSSMMQDATAHPAVLGSLVCQKEGKTVAWLMQLASLFNLARRASSRLFAHGPNLKGSASKGLPVPPPPPLLQIHADGSEARKSVKRTAPANGTAAKTSAIPHPPPLRPLLQSVLPLPQLRPASPMQKIVMMCSKISESVCTRSVRKFCLLSATLR